ncbi:hypothetical protein [Streptomyces sp. NRRL B-24572]|nr:hypothetical protein [Streptomyces sp. NRRL B-24572]
MRQGIGSGKPGPGDRLRDDDVRTRPDALRGARGDGPALPKLPPSDK